MRLGRMIQGDLGEQARISKLFGRAFNMNKLSGNDNAPLVDLATEKSFESVKVYSNPKYYASHLCDIQCADKWASSRQIGLTNKVAQLIADKAGDLKKAGYLPKGLSTGSGLQRFKNFIREKTIVVVPDDHVHKARRYLLTHIKENAKFWGIEPGDRKAIVAKWVAAKDRIQGCGRTYNQIVTEAAKTTQRLLKPGTSVKQPFARQPPPATPPGRGAPVPATIPKPAPPPVNPSPVSPGPTRIGPGPSPR